jgi:hypothetical protein
MTTADPVRWIPFRWPESWTTRAAIDLIRNTPINCVVLRVGAPLAADLERAGFTVQPDSIVNREQGATDWSDPGPVLAIRDCPWPQVATHAGSDSFEAGPTGLPWIDANGWFIQMARARMPGKPVWIATQPPEKAVLRPSAWAIAVADAEAYGARSLPLLDAALAAGILAGNAEARRSWDAYAGALRFFRRPADPLPDYGLVAGLSDFAAENQGITHEYFNLIAREYAPARVLWKQVSAPAIPGGVKLVVYLDPTPPPAPWRDLLRRFQMEGGMVVAGPGTMPVPPGSPTPLDPLAYDQYPVGQGRLVVARSHYDDPWRLAADTRLILGRRFDLLRFANAGSCNIAFKATADARRAQLRLINYAGRPSINPVTATLLYPYRTARMGSLDRPDAPVNLPIHRESRRTVLHVPEFSVYAEINLEM